MKLSEAFSEIKALVAEVIQVHNADYPAAAVWWEDEDPPAYVPVNIATCELGMVSLRDESVREVDSYDEDLDQWKKNQSTLKLMSVQFKFESISTTPNPLALETQSYVSQILQTEDGRQRAKARGLAVLGNPQLITTPRRRTSDGRLVECSITEFRFRFEYHFSDTPVVTQYVIKEVIQEPTITVPGEEE